MSKIICILISSIFLFSCKKENKNVEKNKISKKTEIVEKNTIDGYWQLQKVDDEIFDIDKLVGYNQDQPTMIIDLKEKTVQGFSGCNTYSGKLQYYLTNLSFSNIVATEKSCNINDWEENYYRRLSEIQKFELIEKDLKIFGKNGESMLFKKLPL